MQNKNSITLRKKLASLLREYEMTPYLLSKKSELSPTAISRILKGETKVPRPQNLDRIAKALGVSAEELVSGTDAEESVDTELLSDAVTTPKADELQTAEYLDLSELIKADPRSTYNCFGLFKKKVPLPPTFTLGEYVCVQVNDNALAPTVCAGDLVYIERFVFDENSDPDKTDVSRAEGADIADGNLIAAVIADKEKPFVLLGEKVTDARGRVWIKRYTVDPDGNTFFLVKRYLGIVAGISREFPRKYLELEL